ncbi:uncharacterized protein [Amphiura filiformis]|uniref:uncharacterized protein n=1 Tax=Amphiura filiformis TaxID=82378 RepID=UPI003B213F07
MVNFCVIKDCATRSDRDKASFFRLPTVITNQGEKTQELSEERKRRWLSAVSRENRKTDFKAWDRICSRHFVSGKKAELYDNHNVDWVPTLELGHDKHQPPTPTAISRRNRAKQRTRRKAEEKAAAEEENAAAEEAMKEKEAAEALVVLQVSTNETDGNESTEAAPRDGFHNQEVQACSPVSDCGTQMETQTTQTIETQTDLTGDFLDKMYANSVDINEELYSIRDKLNHVHETDEACMKDSDERVKYYTGLPNFLVLSAVFDLIAPYLKKTHRSLLTKFQQMMLVLMRIRLNLSEQDLAYRFNVSQSTVSRIFRATLDVMFTRLQHLIIWPEREVLRDTMPMQFRKEFGQRVAVIIDCFEIFIDRPSNLLARAQTWSNYKHHNTIKYLIGITPQGTTSFLSKAWGGRTSDKVITEESGFLNKLDPGDLVLADRGFTITEMVAMQGAQVHIPSFTRGKKQLSAADIALTRKIANVRIHVERVIGSTRQKYTILRGPIPIDLLDKDVSSGLTVMDKIAKLCCSLNNINPSVVDFE